MIAWKFVGRCTYIIISTMLANGLALWSAEHFCRYSANQICVPYIHVGLVRVRLMKNQHWFTWQTNTELVTDRYGNRDWYSQHIAIQHKPYIDGLVQERHNSSALAMELHLSCTNPSIRCYATKIHKSICMSFLGELNVHEGILLGCLFCPCVSSQTAAGFSNHHTT